VAKKKKPARKAAVMKNNKDLPGISLERIVARIQQMMDPQSTVTHNEKLVDRVGNERQYDVVIRGHFGGRPVLGVIECKDHSRKKGPDAVEAFAKKTENLGANLRLMVSKRGFTEQALALAKHEHIGCLSLLPADPKQTGFSIGDMWYGVISKWTDIRLIVFSVNDAEAPAEFVSGAVKWQGIPVINWFLKELFTTDRDKTKEGGICIRFRFDEIRNLEIDGKEYAVTGVACIANGMYAKKKKWVKWTGDAFYDWHAGAMHIPPKGEIIGSAVESDISAWDDYDGEIPAHPEGFLMAVVYKTQTWDNTLPIPDLTKL
jgi:hypothetical protein